MNETSDASLRVTAPPVDRRSMRIAFVTETYPPEVNGVALTVARMVDGLQRRHHRVQLVRPRQAADEAIVQERFDEVLMRGLPIPMYPHLRMGLPASGALGRLWSRDRPDVVHIATEGPLGYSALQVARRLGLPVTTDFRTNFHAYSRHYGLGVLRTPIMAYLRRFHNAARLTMVPTEPLRAELTAAGFRDVSVVSRGVDTVLFDPARRSTALRRSWGVDDHDLVLCHVGRLAPEKNLALLEQACAAVRRSRPRTRLLLVGEGPAQAELERRMPEAIFAGRRTSTDLAAHYASADLFLFPSLTETFGNVTLEAMACGLPVVAFDYAAAARLIESGRSGLLVPFGDTDRFVDAACRAANDAGLRRVLASAARAMACLQGWDDIDARFEAALLDVVDGQLRVDPPGAPVHALS